ncbi:MAG TPA: hypothetical protein PKI32_02205 [Opitutales bacterium]|nr:hypothetical protein [Opitutales bacterium]
MKTALPVLAALALFPFSQLAAQTPPSDPSPDAGAAAEDTEELLLCGGDWPSHEPEWSLSTEYLRGEGAGGAGGLVSFLNQRFVNSFQMRMLSMEDRMQTFSFEMPVVTRCKGDFGSFHLGAAFPTQSKGTFIVEAGYLGGEGRFDSGIKTYSGSGLIYDEDVEDIRIHGKMRVAYAQDTDAFDAVFLWQPPRLGEYVGVGLCLGYSRFSGTYDVLFTTAYEQDDESFSYDLLNNRLKTRGTASDVLLLIRATDRPLKWISARDGSWGFVPKVEFAAGYSFRETDDILIRYEEDGQSEYATAFDGMDEYMDDAWVLKSRAGLEFFCTVGRLRASLAAGYRYDAEIDGDNGAEFRGVFGRLGLSAQW